MAHLPHLHPRRDELQTYLSERGVQTLIHYPIPPHRQKAYAEWKDLHLPVTEAIHLQELSLPISPVITDPEADAVISIINDF